MFKKYILVYLFLYFMVFGEKLKCSGVSFRYMCFEKVSVCFLDVFLFENLWFVGWFGRYILLFSKDESIYGIESNEERGSVDWSKFFLELLDF